MHISSHPPSLLCHAQVCFQVLETLILMFNFADTSCLLLLPQTGTRYHNRRRKKVMVESLELKQLMHKGNCTYRKEDFHFILKPVGTTIRNVTFDLDVSGVRLQDT